MIEFEVWSEGYVITGNSGQAHMMGKIKANSFQEACDKLLLNDKYYNSERLSYWGCKLYDNRADASKSFG